MTARRASLPFVLGCVLVLGGLAHAFGVTRLYASRGLPDANRILLDVWIAEAQVVAGAFFVVSARVTTPRPWAIAGALFIWTYALVFLPVLFRRAPVVFWIPPITYSLLSVRVVRAAQRVVPRPP